MRVGSEIPLCSHGLLPKALISILDSLEARVRLRLNPLLLGNSPHCLQRLRNHLSSPTSPCDHYCKNALPSVLMYASSRLLGPTCDLP